jgi:uncharacterized membrane protein
LDASPDPQCSPAAGRYCPGLCEKGLFACAHAPQLSAKSHRRDALRIKYHELVTPTPAVSHEPPADSPGAPLGSERDQISQNIEAVLEFYTRADQNISRSQRIVERISLFAGQPIFLGIILLFVASWMLANAILRQVGMAEFDPPPFPWLQAIVGLGALLAATVVLTKQNRAARLAEQREHLDLKVMLLTEQKTAKLIDLLEELRRDLPNVKDRHDPEAAALKQSMNPDQVLAALDERSEPDERLKRAGEANATAGSRK